MTGYQPTYIPLDPNSPPPRRRHAGLWIVPALLTLLIPAGVAAYFYRYSANLEALRADGVETTGVVEGIKFVHGNGPRTRSFWVVWYTYPVGTERYRGSFQSGEPPEGFEAGMPLTVVYLPGEPKNHVRGRPTPADVNQAWWLGLGLTGVLAGLMLVLTKIMYGVAQTLNRPPKPW